MEILKLVQSKHAPKSLAAWLDSDDGRNHCSLELSQRLAPAAAGITTLNQLLKHVKERYPDHYSNDWRVTTGAPHSREMMRELWARYLAWKEQGSAQ